MLMIRVSVNRHNLKSSDIFPRRELNVIDVVYFRILILADASPCIVLLLALILGSQKTGLVMEFMNYSLDSESVE